MPTSPLGACCHLGTARRSLGAFWNRKRSLQNPPVFSVCSCSLKRVAVSQLGIFWFWKSIVFCLFNPQLWCTLWDYLSIQSLPYWYLINISYLCKFWPFCFWDCDRGKSSPQASSGHVVELQESCIQMYDPVCSVALYVLGNPQNRFSIW